jgi:hypothetical protein
VEGAWQIEDIETDSADANKGTVKATFTPTDENNYATVEELITWTTEYVELKLVPVDESGTKLEDSAVRAKKGVENYTGLKFALVLADDQEGGSIDETQNINGKSEKEILNKIATALGTTWAVSSKGNLYPASGDYNSITKMLAYVNAQLNDTRFQLTSAYQEPEDNSTQEPDTGDTEQGGSTEESRKDYYWNRDDVDDAVVNKIVNPGTGDSSEKPSENEDLTNILKAINTAQGNTTADTEIGKEQISKADDLKTQLETAAKTQLNLKMDNEASSGEAEEEPIELTQSTIFDITYTDEDGNDGTFGSKQIYLPFNTTDFTYDASKDTIDNYLVAHVVMHDKQNPSRNGTIEYLKPDGFAYENGQVVGLYVTVTSLSLFMPIKTSAAVSDAVVEAANASFASDEAGDVITQPGSVTGDTTDDEKKTDTDTASVAPAAKSDDSGAIILAGAVVATVVVGGIIYYNWDKLPVHKIEGTVVDANGAAVANATVTLAKDGKVVKTITTDANGYYSAKVAKGDYTITVTVGEASATAEGSTGASAQLAIA